MSVRLPPAKCPSCGKTLDAAALPGLFMEPIMPDPGDFTVCVHCAAVLVYDQDHGLHLMTLKLWNSLKPDAQEQIMRVKRAIKR